MRLLNNRTWLTTVTGGGTLCAMQMALVPDDLGESRWAPLEHRAWSGDPERRHLDLPDR